MDDLKKDEDSEEEYDEGLPSDSEFNNEAEKRRETMRHQSMW